MNIFKEAKVALMVQVIVQSMYAHSFENAKSLTCISNMLQFHNVCFYTKRGIVSLPKLDMTRVLRN